MNRPAPLTAAALVLTWALGLAVSGAEEIVLGPAAGELGHHAVAGFNYGNWMQVALHREDIARLGVRTIRFPAGNHGDENPLDDAAVQALRTAWELLGRPDVMIQANLFGLCRGERPGTNLECGTPAGAVAAARRLDLAGVPVRFWAIGNEPDLYATNRGDPSWTPERYCSAFREYAAALREVHPHALITGPAVSGASGSREFLRHFVELCGDVVDVVTWHIYPTDGSGPEQVVLDAADEVPAEIALVRRWLADPSVNTLGYGRRIGIGVTEYAASWRSNRYRFLDDLSGAIFAAEVQAHLISARAELATYFALQATGAHGVIDTAGHLRPTYHALALAGRLRGSVLPLVAHPAEVRGVAARDTDGTLRVLLTNRSERRVRVALRLAAGALPAELILHSLDETTADANGAPALRTIDPADFTLPPRSVSLAAGRGPGRTHVKPDVIALSTWTFRSDPEDVGRAAGWLAAAPGPGWRSVSTPHQWALSTGPDDRLAESGIPYAGELWDYHGAAWYRTRVDALALAGGDRAFVRFEGVDYSAEVYVDGELRARHEGYFEPFEVEVTDRAAGGFDLAVRVEAPFDPGWQHDKSLIKGIFHHHDTRPGDRLGPVTGQSGGTGGVWGSVTVLRTGAARLTRCQVVAQPSSDFATATVRLTARIDGPAGSVLEAVVRDAGGAEVTRGQATAQAGVAALTLRLDRPRLWWPWDRGEPHLYAIEATVTADGAVSDSRLLAFGVRSVEVEPGSGIVRINGQRHFHRGTNYIPTQWLSTFGPADWDRDLRLMREANLNAVRVHAHVLPAEFYAAADRAGLLVWADFPLIWGYVDTPAFHEEADRQLAAMISLLGNHPSIWVWSVHNEPPWREDWIGLGDRNRRLDDLLAATARRLDPTRFVVRASGEFDSHFYPGWYFGRLAEFKNHRPAFSTEYGAQAVPLSLLPILPDDAWPPRAGASSGATPEGGTDPARDRRLNPWGYHDVQIDLIERNVGRIRDFDGPEDLALATQRYQVEYVRLVTEHFRRLKYAPTGGAYQFMFVEDWDAGTWGVLDYHRVPKLGYAALREAMAPVLVSLAWPSVAYVPGREWRAELWVVNDLACEHPAAQLTVEVHHQRLGRIHAEVRTIDLAADSAERLEDLVFAVPAGASGPATIELTLRDEAGGILAENSYDLTG
jgi:beta-mannosidase